MPKFRERAVTMSFLDVSDGSKNYYYHDDRAGGGRPQRGGIRKMNNNRRGGNRKGPWLDDDIDMAGSAEGRRHAPYYRGQRGSYPRRGGYSGKSVHYIDRNDPGWFKVTIIGGKNHDQATLLRTLQSMSRETFIAFNYHVENTNSVFFVENGKIALSLKQADKKFVSPNGQRIVMRFQKEKVPVVNLEGKVKEKLTLVMSNRYNTETKALSLNALARDPDLRAEALYVPLSRPVVMNCVCHIILEHIPELQALDLSSNELDSLDRLSVLKNSSVQNLKTLILNENSLGHLNALEPINGLPLVELSLLKNPVSEKAKDSTTYVSDIRRKFPELLILDGKQLPPIISFDLEETPGVVPKALPFFAPTDQSKDLVGQFVEQYYKIFDSDNRQSLLDAYHDNCYFSYICTVSKFMNDHSRNLNKIRDPERRHRNLKQGKVNIVSCLSEFPSTQHDFESFIIDIPLFLPSMVKFSITGVFKDTDDSHHAIYNFNRVFLLTPVGSGFCIINETWFINNALGSQIKAAFKAPAPTPSPSPTPQGATPHSSLPTSPISGQLLPQQEQMVIAFAKESTMNMEFSLKCLVDHGWNWEAAGKTFAQLNSEGKIPREAFIQ